MKHAIVEIAPSMAKDWLEKVPSYQRKFVPDWVNKYAQDMEAGNWTVTHQGIAFDSKGDLVDGQHRLHAIIKFGHPVKILVTRDAPATTYNHTDLGAARRVTDVLQSGGDGWINSEVIAIARHLENAHAGSGANAAIRGGLSPFEAKRICYAHRNAITFVLSNIPRHVRGVTVAPVLAAVAAGWYWEDDRVGIANFLRLLVNGVAEDPERDSVAIKLRDFLRDNSGGASTGFRQEANLKTQRVLKAYLRCEKLAKIQMPEKQCYPRKPHFE